MASSDKNKKKSSGGGSAAARKSSTGGGKSGASSAAKQTKGQKAAAKDTKSTGLGNRWKRARQSAKTGAAKSAASKSSSKGEKRGLSKFLKDVRVELRKVTWPTRKDLAQSTLVVIVAVAISGAYVGALDYIFGIIVEYVQNLIT